MIFSPAFLLNSKYKVNGADFDGTNDYLAKASDLTGVSDSKLVTLVFWLRTDALNATNYVLDGAGSSFDARLDASGDLTIIGANSAAVTILSVKTASGYAAGATWRCFMASFDMSNAAKRHIYVGDTSDLAVTTFTDDTIDLTPGSWQVGATSGGSKIDGCLAEFWFAPGVYIDFSVEANRRLFYSASGKPVSLGGDGSVPTGTVPALYLRLSKHDAVASFATNRGSGGNFSITGSLDIASSSPSD